MIIAEYRFARCLVPLACSSRRLSPGDLVRHELWPGSLGLVVCVAPEQVGVLWSRADEAMRALDSELDTIRKTL